MKGLEMPGTLILGGGGMIGQKLARYLRDNVPAESLTLFDLAFPSQRLAGTTYVTGNVTDSSTVQQLADQRFDTIYHLASVVSGEAEVNFLKGWQTNLHSMFNFLEALRRVHQESGGFYRPKVIFSSSIAVFGGPYPDPIPDDFKASPQSSYGAQKVACELVLQDYARKGYIDAVSLRLPTICVRPGKPNLAASSFFSGIIREPLNGQRAVLPVPETVRHWFASPRAAVGFLVHAERLDTGLLDGHRAINLPGVSCTVADQIEALRDVAGASAVGMIVRKPDPNVAAIISRWPEAFAATRAKSLGFKADATFSDIIKAYIADEMSHQTF